MQINVRTQVCNIGIILELSGIDNFLFVNVKICQGHLATNIVVIIIFNISFEISKLGIIGNII